MVGVINSDTGTVTLRQVGFPPFYLRTEKNISAKVTNGRFVLEGSLKTPLGFEILYNRSYWSDLFVFPGKALSLASIGTNIASIFTGWFTGDPGAWINWYGSNKSEIGKINYHPDKDCYWQITNKIETKVNGVVTRAIVSYNVFEDYIWDDDEKMCMGVLKLATFTENIDVVNKTSTDATLFKL